MVLKRTGAVTFVAILITGAGLLFAGCPRKGPAQRAGEKIDRAVEDVQDTLDPAGPAEEAGREIDRAVDDLKR